MPQTRYSPTSACKEPLLSLQELATLPLHRVGITGEINKDGLMFAVGGVSAKAKAASDTPGIRAFAVSSDQTYKTDDGVDKPVGEHIEGLRVIRSKTLGSLLKGILDTVGDEVYGPVVPLPEVLNQADSERLSYDYRFKSFCAFGWLDQLVHRAIHGKPETPAHSNDKSQAWSGDPPVDAVVKRSDRGYIHVLGTAACGKTSWALNWMRQSMGMAAPKKNKKQEFAGVKLPDLAGWYFARRYSGDQNGLHEVHALQNLISLARRKHDVVPSKRELLPPDTIRDQYGDQRSKGDEPQNVEKTLRNGFLDALKEMAGKASPEKPLVFVIDGGDEMWADGAPFERSTFPSILPDTDHLPPHVYLVLLSRPGDHMTGYAGKEPILRVDFSSPEILANVNSSIRTYLTDQAEALQEVNPEAYDLLIQPTLQDKVCDAAEGAFGYAPILLMNWLPSSDLSKRIDPGKIEELKTWEMGLPRGIYGLRAQQFVEMSKSKGGSSVTLAKALAIVTQLRWPLKPTELIELIYPEWPDQAKELAARLRRGAQWLTGTSHGANESTLRFGHKSLAEVAQAAWRLECAFPLQNQLSAHDLEAEARVLAGERDVTGVLNSPKRARADAQLQGILAGNETNRGCHERWKDQNVPAPTKPWIGPHDKTQDTVMEYSLVWGPLHALKAAAQLSGYKSLGQRSRELLLNAPYLQSAIRAHTRHSGVEQSQAGADALRETFIAADELPDADPDKWLRHLAESALLHWYQIIALGQTQVGVVLWNLIGKEDAVRGELWKTSIDQEALITCLPGKAQPFVRRLRSGGISALTPCGQWLVTSGEHGTTVWDLRKGWHRAHPLSRHAVGLEHLCAVSAGDTLAFGGRLLKQDHILALCQVHIGTGRAHLALYGRHNVGANSFALQPWMDATGQQGWAVGCGYKDGYVGLLLRTSEQLKNDTAELLNGVSQISGQILLYGGHDDPVNSVALQPWTDAKGLQGLALATGSGTPNYGYVGLLLRNAEQLKNDASRHRNQIDSIEGQILRYDGLNCYVSSVALQPWQDGEGKQGWVLASGGGIYKNGYVGLLQRNWEQLKNDTDSFRDGAAPISDQMLRYEGSIGSVNSVALQPWMDATGRQGWAIASGGAKNRSDDGYVGLLLRNADQMKDDTNRLQNGVAKFTGQILLYAGHSIRVGSVAMQQWKDATGQNGLAIASRSATIDAGYVGLLLRTPEQLKNDTTELQNGATYFTGQMLLYSGQKHYDVSVALHSWMDATGQQSWAIVSGSRTIDSDNGYVGLLLRTSEQLKNDTTGLQNGSTYFAGQLLLYGGHCHPVRSVAMQPWKDGEGTKGWVLASGCGSGTYEKGNVGLLQRNWEQLKNDTNRFRDGASPISGQILLYGGHDDTVNSVALQPWQDATGQQGWALASGSGVHHAGYVGLLLRTADQLKIDTAKFRDESDTITDQIRLYGGHETAVRSVALQPWKYEQGEQGWALASGSFDCVGLILHVGKQLENDTSEHRDGSHDIASQMLLYGGQEGFVISVALQPWQDATGRLGLVLASGSLSENYDAGCVGVLLRTWRQLKNDNAKFRDGSDQIADQMLLYHGHSGEVTSVAVQPWKDAKGEHGWVLASGSGSPYDGCVGLFQCTTSDVLARVKAKALQNPISGNPVFIPLQWMGGLNCLRSVARSPSGTNLPRWFGVGNEGVVFLNSQDTNESEGVAVPSLTIPMVCPIDMTDFKAMDVAQGDDSHYAIAGASGSSVALMLLEKITPKAQKSPFAQ